MSFGLGFLAIEASGMAGNNVPIEKIVESLKNMKDRTFVFAVLDTLEYLRRSGRASNLKVLMGSLLNVHPILKIKDNIIQDIAKPRTKRRAMNEFLEIIGNHAPFERVGVVHADAENKALRLAEDISAFYTGNILVTEIGPAVTIHAGPGVIGVCLVTQKLGL